MAEKKEVEDLELGEAGKGNKKKLIIIIAAAVFVGVKAINQLQQQKQAAPTAPSNEEKLLSEIRDLLKSQSR